VSGTLQPFVVRRFPQRFPQHGTTEGLQTASADRDPDGDTLPRARRHSPDGDHQRHAAGDERGLRGHVAGPAGDLLEGACGAITRWSFSRPSFGVAVAWSPLAGVVSATDEHPAWPIASMIAAVASSLIV